MKKSKILIISDPSSAHTVKWANGLSDTNFDVFVFGFSENPDLLQYKKNISVFNYYVNSKIKSKSDGSLQKLIYLKCVFKLRRIIKEFKPDILHAHYATSYGLLAFLSGFKPYILSVWGSDINDFPTRNKLFPYVLKFLLSRAALVCATSYDLAENTNKYYKKNITIIPFGIDTEIFKPIFKAENVKYIGIVKTLEINYGVEYLIRAFSLIKKIRKDFDYKLLIVGGGSLLNQLKALTEELGISSETEFTNYIEYKQVHKYHQKLTIGIYPSFKESFGVAIAETMACGGAVIASNVGGIKEIVSHNINGLLVDPMDVNQIANYILYLIDSPEILQKFIKEGRETIVENYSLNYAIKKMAETYSLLLQKTGK
ncbi:MAG: glycosyltransferase [bacterium]